MRLGDGKIRLDKRWQTELSAAQIANVNIGLEKFLTTADNSTYTGLFERYLDQ